MAEETNCLKTENGSLTAIANFDFMLA